MLLLMLLTGSRAVMGDRVNSPSLAALGWITTIAIFAATLGLVVSWVF
jgi:Mn2+/Fe2+ NRAMP family transporter